MHIDVYVWVRVSAASAVDACFFFSERNGFHSKEPTHRLTAERAAKGPRASNGKIAYTYSRYIDREI